MPNSHRNRRGARRNRKRRSAAVRITPQSKTHLDTDQSRTPAQSAGERTLPLHLAEVPVSPTDDIDEVPGGGLSDTSPPTEVTGELELEEYVQRIEDAAARSRVSQETGASTARPRRIVTTTGHVDAEAAAPGRRTIRKVKKKRKKAESKPFFKRRKTWFIIAASLPILLATLITLYMLNFLRIGISAYQDIHEEPIERTRWQVNPEGTPEPVPTEENSSEVSLPTWDGEDPINIMLLGVDAREGDDRPPRSDTTIVVNIDPQTEEVSMMSIPRDLLVYIPGFGDDKFNAAFPIGEANSDDIPGGGTTLVAQTIEANFDISIHHFATVDFSGFRQIVDTVGGVVVDNPSLLSDNLYPTDDGGVTRVYFPTGLQKLDGDDALQYVRTRHADSDLGRADRQQQVLMAIRQQAVDRDMISRAQQLIEDLRDTIRTDLDFNQMLALSNLGRQITNEDIARFNLWEEGLLSEQVPETESDAYYLVADWESLWEAKVEYFGEDDPPDAAEGDENAPDQETGEEDELEPDLEVPVFVENGTDASGLAGNSAQVLAEAGFNAVWPGNARGDQVETVIEDYTEEEEGETARYIAGLLGIPETAIVPSTGGEGITVILGEDAPEELIPADEDEVEETE